MDGVTLMLFLGEETIEKEAVFDKPRQHHIVAIEYHRMGRTSFD
jgi:hypothetical protein